MLDTYRTTKVICFNENVPVDVYCGDCWRGMSSNVVCMSLFSILSVVFLLAISLMICYHYQRSKAHVEIISKSFYFVFAFIIIWMATRLVYFTDAFYNYDYKIEATLATLPVICACMAISIALYNV